jgi:putative protease
MSDYPSANPSSSPEILAPAGSQESFMAALAAEADAIYCGLQSYSARMAAKNFTVEQLAALVALAHRRQVKVYVAFNSLLMASDLAQAQHLLDQLNTVVRPDGLIFQDLALVSLARQVGFQGELHLSTLANVSFAEPLAKLLQQLSIDRVVTPRELTVDEIKQMAARCPQQLGLEVFVHGALCYGVSGRCYWSSFLGGKSGLRGRCVQPCRRVFRQASQSERFFSCTDLSLDVLVKVIKPIGQIKAWKIEGRKKGPHYVYYTVSAYRMLRDHGNDPQARRAAQQLLQLALGRPGTHYNFLSHRRYNPIDDVEQTGSGLLVGTVRGGPQKSYIQLREALLPGDLLRVGYEDQHGHQTLRIGRAVPRRGRYHLKSTAKRSPSKGTPVFLIDRREAALTEMIATLEAQLPSATSVKSQSKSRPKLRLPQAASTGSPAGQMRVFRSQVSGPLAKKDQVGLWFDPQRPLGFRGRVAAATWHWLPPVIWPENETDMHNGIQALVLGGARQFVLNVPWQRYFFENITGCRLWAGPFCNIANGLAVEQLAAMGFAGAIVSPELDRDNFLALPAQSPLPLGIVLSGFWPLAISRTVNTRLKLNQSFQSPRKEGAWTARYGDNYWVFPNWRLDFIAFYNTLLKTGYRLFVHLDEPVPKKVSLKRRPGTWNWDLRLK